MGCPSQSLGSRIDVVARLTISLTAIRTDSLVNRHLRSQGQAAFRLPRGPPAGHARPEGYFTKWWADQRLWDRRLCARAGRSNVDRAVERTGAGTTDDFASLAPQHLQFNSFSIEEIPSCHLKLRHRRQTQWLRIQPSRLAAYFNERLTEGRRSPEVFCDGERVLDA